MLEEKPSCLRKLSLETRLMAIIQNAKKLAYV